MNGKFFGFGRKCPGCGGYTIYSGEEIIAKLPLCPKCEVAHSEIKQTEIKSTKEERDDEKRKVKILDG